MNDLARSLAPLAWAALGCADTAAHASRRRVSLRQAAVLEAMQDQARRGVMLQSALEIRLSLPSRVRSHLFGMRHPGSAAGSVLTSLQRKRLTKVYANGLWRLTAAGRMFGREKADAG